mmetsp:Transcript_35987/g.113098  ORF Transcript_35987/g.113098 Transcript_35987/m.113098 type:complete len:112 (+) Transcript_35987:307-642(+)
MAAKPDAKAAADCDEVACSSKMAAFRGMLGLGAAPAASAGAATRCPPDRDEIGRSGWTLLHTTAAYYPADPTSKDVRAAQVCHVARVHVFIAQPRPGWFSLGRLAASSHTP